MIPGFSIVFASVELLWIERLVFKIHTSLKAVVGI